MKGTMRYSGVVPEQRGNGYVNDLLAKGINILQNIGIFNIQDHVDSVNFAMLRAVERAGYKHVCTRYEHGASLDDLMSEYSS